MGEEFKKYVEQRSKIVRLNAENSMYLETYNLVLDLYLDPYFDKQPEKVQTRLNAVIIKWEHDLSKDLEYLAIIGSISPFIGLFGTVWGIMHSFQAIAVSNSSGISVVAPAISEALFVTACGIFVAIPANVFAHIFYSKIDYFSKDQVVFKDYLVKRLEEQLKL